MYRILSRLRLEDKVAELSMEQSETEREQAVKQLSAKLGRGAAQAARGELLDGNKVLEEMRDLIQERRRVKKKVSRR